MNLALTPTFQTEVTMDGKQEPLTLTWVSTMGCAIGYDANLLKPDPTSSIAPLAFRGIEPTGVTFTVMLSSTPAAELVEESKKQSEYAQSTVTLTRSGYQATRLTLPDTRMKRMWTTPFPYSTSWKLGSTPGASPTPSPPASRRLSSPSWMPWPTASV